jgi:YVTN family beta-propeller protein
MIGLVFVAATLAIAVPPNAHLAYLKAGNISGFTSASSENYVNITVGVGPQMVVLNSKGTYAYVANNGSGTVSVIDLKSDKVTATIPTGPLPTGLALSPNGRYLYVSRTLNDAAFGRSLSIISTAANKVTKELNVGGSSNDVVFSPDGRYAYVTALESGPGLASGVTIVSAASQRVTGTIPVTAIPGTVAVSPNGRALYVNTEYGSPPGGGPETSYLEAINLTSRRVVAVIKQENLVSFDIAVNPDGLTLYESSDEADIKTAVWVMSTVTDKITAKVCVKAGNGLAFSPSGSRAYVCNADGTGLSVIDTATHRVIEQIPMRSAPFGPEPFDIAVSPDGRDAYVLYNDVVISTIGTLTVVPLGASGNPGPPGRGRDPK